MHDYFGTKLYFDNDNYIENHPSLDINIENITNDGIKDRRYDNLYYDQLSNAKLQQKNLLYNCKLDLNNSSIFNKQIYLMQFF